jgi:hypothetical protein
LEPDAAAQIAEVVRTPDRQRELEVERERELEAERDKVRVV